MCQDNYNTNKRNINCNNKCRTFYKKILKSL